MKRFVTFGEVMARLTAPGHLRLQQALPGSLDVTFGGAEANVAASLAMLGAKARFVTVLPSNPIADACIASLRTAGVDTQSIIRSHGGRLGLYFLEQGANQRPSRVIYDRQHSAMSVTVADAYDWGSIFTGADWLHVTGITPSLSNVAAEATISAVRQAKQANLSVSCDLNYRSKLWRWDAGTAPRKLAGRVMRQVLPFVDLLIANEADCADVLGIHAAGDVEGGHVDASAFPAVARRVVGEFPNINKVAITLRESLSASHNRWGAMLLDAANDSVCFAPSSGDKYHAYEIHNIVDRVGAGDSFGAGLLFALNSEDYATPDEALAFAVAASCLAHSIVGDFNFSSRDEIDQLAAGAASGRVVR